MLCNCWLLLVLNILLMILSVRASQVSTYGEENGVKYGVYLSPKIVLGAGAVEDKFHNNIDFPRGHIAIKEFKAELVDETGNPIPLHETYLHHWTASRYYYLKEDYGDRAVKIIPLTNSGRCEYSFPQYFGLGSETRRTDEYVPDPFGIVVGNPADVPKGYGERWYLNIHAIDTRGVVDKSGCTECRCDLYNITRDEFQRPLSAGYNGGALCCYDQTQCRVREGFQSVKRHVYMKYTVRWVDWVDTIVPVRIYILDVTDNGERPETDNQLVRLAVEPSCSAERGCQVEYEVEQCGLSPGVSDDKCVDTRRTSIVMPRGGYLVYGVAHQHSGAIGAGLYAEDGRMICSSMATYGQGEEAGNEAGYIVGMSSCRPEPGRSIKISDGETLTVESNYSSTQMHTGVMGAFYILIADKPSNNHISSSSLINIQENNFLEMLEKLNSQNYLWGLLVIVVATVTVAAISYRRRPRNELENYKSIVL